MGRFIPSRIRTYNIIFYCRKSYCYASKEKLQFQDRSEVPASMLELEISQGDLGELSEEKFKKNVELLRKDRTMIPFLGEEFEKKLVRSVSSMQS